MINYTVIKEYHKKHTNKIFVSKSTYETLYDAKSYMSFSSYAQLTLDNIDINTKYKIENFFNDDYTIIWLDKVNILSNEECTNIYD